MSGPRSGRPVKSRPRGPAIQQDGTRTTAYEALVPLTCGQCGQEIAVGALFTRRVVPMSLMGIEQLKRVPACTQCRPLQAEEPDGANGHG